MVVETIVGGVIAVAKVAKVGFVTKKATAVKSCGAKSTIRAQKADVSKLNSHIAGGKIHARTEAAKQKVHAAGHNLFQGNYPIGEDLSNVKGTPAHEFGPKGFTSSEVFNLPENLEGTYISIHEIGWAQFFSQVLDSDLSSTLNS